MFPDICLDIRDSCPFDVHHFIPVGCYLAVKIAHEHPAEFVLRVLPLRCKIDERVNVRQGADPGTELLQGSS